MKQIFTRSFIFALLFFIAGSAIATPNSKQIRESIISQTRQISDVGAFELVVDARWGEVTLFGSVGSQRIAAEIERLASSTEGVGQVTNLLKVDPSLAARKQVLVPAQAARSIPSDRDISENILRALRQEDGLNVDQIKLTTTDGVVTFRGEQKNFRDVDRILSMALMVEGVRDVRSEMNVGGRPYLEVAPR